MPTIPANDSSKRTREFLVDGRPRFTQVWLLPRCTVKLPKSASETNAIVQNWCKQRRTKDETQPMCGRQTMQTGMLLDLRPRLVVGHAKKTQPKAMHDPEHECLQTLVQTLVQRHDFHPTWDDARVGSIASSNQPRRKMRDLADADVAIRLNRHRTAFLVHVRTLKWRGQTAVACAHGLRPTKCPHVKHTATLPCKLLWRAREKLCKREWHQESPEHISGNNNATVNEQRVRHRTKTNMESVVVDEETVSTGKDFMKVFLRGSSICFNVGIQRSKR